MSYLRSTKSEVLAVISCPWLSSFFGPMNIFRLVLCLAGLALYLIAKQHSSFDSNSKPLSPPMPGSSPEAQQSEPRFPRPSAHPHEFLKADKSYVDAKR